MTITDRLGGARTVLLEEPSMGGGREVCTSLLTDGVGTPNVLFVSFTRQPGACVDQLEETEASDVGVVMVGESGTADHDHADVRSVGDAATADRADVAVETVPTPSDLTGLGIEIGPFLSEWDVPVTVCFDSVTAMLQYVDFETACEFLHAITGQVHAAGARAHFHVDPGAHDEQAIAGITALFEASVSVEDTDVSTREVIR